MVESMEIEHCRRLRAERVQALLKQLWGEELPPGPAAALTVLIDAVGVDDFYGAEDRLVSQGDGLSYQVLATLWQHYRTWSLTDPSAPESGAGLHLPQVLAQRLRLLQLLPTPAPAPTPVRASAAGAAAESSPTGPSVVGSGAVGSGGGVDARTGPTPVVAEVGEFARVGVWEIDPQTGIVAFDAVAAQLIGDGDVAGCSTVARHMQELIHPDDHAPITSALQEVSETETAYRVRFRVRSPEGVITHLISHGRMLHKPSDPYPRLTGYLAIDRDGEPAATSEGDPHQKIINLT